MLAGTDLEGARRVAEKVRAAVADLDVPKSAASESGRVTISVGAASVVPSERKSAEELMAAADRALYKAKRAGRNRVEW